MNRTALIGGLGVILVAIVAEASLFTLNETEQGVVLRLGEPRRTIRDAGLDVKLPFIENVVVMDKRVLDLDPPVEQVILFDQKRLDVDAFARYRIHDPLRFYQTVGTEEGARVRLNAIVNSAMRRVLGAVTLQTVLSEERTRVMADIREQVNREATGFGIEIVDVRIRRADLPDETSQSIFARMKSEREREAAEARAQGQEQAQEIRARAERERTVLLAEAQRNAQGLRGEGDQQAMATIATATREDPAFYKFYRSLDAYRKAFEKDGNTTLVLSPTAEFFRYFAKGPAAIDDVTAPALPVPPPSSAPAPAAPAAPAPAAPAEAPAQP